jgi:hypothetical protein
VTTYFDVGRRSRPSEPAETVEQVVSGMSWMIGPVAPTPALRAPALVSVTGAAGAGTDVQINLINRQRSPTAVRIGVGSLLDRATGRTWRPGVSAFAFLQGETSSEVRLALDIPASLNPGTYEGVLVLVATEAGRVPLEVIVT